MDREEGSEEGREGRVEFQMMLPRLDVQIRPPQVEGPLPVSAAEEAKRRPDPPIKRFVWSNYEESGFPSRVNHATATCRNGNDGREYMYSIGGFHSSDEDREKRALTDQSPAFHTGPIDVYCLDVDTRKWSKVNVIRTTANKDIPIRGGEPPRRYGHTCVSYRDKIFMYGGRNDDDGSFRVIECFDSTRSMWLKLRPTAEGCSLPRSRDGQACCTQGSTMFMHGGFDIGSLVFSGEMYSFDMETFTWRLLSEGSEDMPERDFHSAVCLKDRIVVFGGRSDFIAPNFSNNDIYDSNFYEFTLSDKKWTRIKPKGYQPCGRRSLAAVRYSDDKVLYFGGYNAGQKRHFNDVFIYDINTQYVTEVVPYGIPPSPRRRTGHSIVGCELVTCGGTSPVQKMFAGKNRWILRDHNDMHILSFLPTLQQLAMMVVKEQHLSTAILPIHIRQQLQEF